jgi:aryl-alcohol dehydrogenase-like predicted oxidoreductase
MLRPREPNHEVVGATKVTTRWEDPNHQGYVRHSIVAAVEHSLCRLPTDHLDRATAFAIAYRGVTSALRGPRTMEQPDDVLAGADITLYE